MSSRSIAAVAAAACALSLAACSSSSTDSKDSGKSAASSSSKSTPPPAAKDVWNKTQERVGTYKSAKMHMQGLMDGKKADLTFTAGAGNDPLEITGTLDGDPLSVRQVHGKSYVKASEGYWTKELKGEGGSTLSHRLANVWLISPKSGASEYKPLEDLTKEITDDKDPANVKLLAPSTTVTNDSIDGKACWKLTAADKKTTMWVSSDGSYDLLKAQGFDSKNGSSERMESMTFLSHDQTYDVPAPSDAKEITSLMK